MKKFLILIVLLIALPCQAQDLARLSAPMLGAGVSAAAVVYTDCSQFPSGASFYWNGDYAGPDTDQGCSSASTSIAGTFGAGGAVSATGTDPGTASPESAGNALKFDSATSEYLRWSVSSDDIANLDEGRASLDLYAAATTGFTTLNILYIDVNNHLKLRVGSDGTLRLDHLGTGTRLYIDSTAKLPDTTWTRVLMRWSVSNNKMAIKIGANDWQEGTGTFAAKTGTLGYLSLDDSSHTDTLYIDNVVIYASYAE